MRRPRRVSDEYASTTCARSKPQAIYVIHSLSRGMASGVVNSRQSLWASLMPRLSAILIDIGKRESALICVVERFSKRTDIILRSS